MKAIQIHSALCILYVQIQNRSTEFYSKLFRMEPVLNVPGMTEFVLSSGLKLGLMTNDGMAKILSEHLPHPAIGNGIPRCELYCLVDDIESEYQHARAMGAQLISPLEDRDWGDKVCYFADPDGHIIAFAQPIL